MLRTPTMIRFTTPLLALSLVTLTLAPSRAPAQPAQPPSETRVLLNRLTDQFNAAKKQLDATTADLAAQKKASADATKAAADAKSLADDLSAQLKAAKEQMAAMKPDTKAAELAAAADAKAGELAAQLASLKETVAKGMAAPPAPAPAPAPPPGETPKPAEAPAPAAGTDATAKAIDEVKAAAATASTDGKKSGDTAWMLISSALVMLMVPGLALFYGGMVRGKNVLATMMQSLAALGIVGVYWLAFGYGLAFGPSKINLPAMGGFDAGGFLGWSWGLFFLNGVSSSDYLPGYNIPVYTHVMFQGMFAIITPALISGAVAERIRFWPFVIFMLLWVTLVYCPLAHMVWAWSWFLDTPHGMILGPGTAAIGFLGKNGALDFAGGTVVHIAAGFAGLALCLVLRKRVGYPDHPMPPNGMVLTLTGAALLWFGWFGFNGGSYLASNQVASSAFTATQAAAAAAAISWIFVEWLVKGKPTALGLASGVVAGLVAVTPASGYVSVVGGLIIGLLAGAVCYGAVYLKGVFGYDDSLDAFGVHGIGGFLGAVLTGVFCASAINSAAVVAPAVDGLAVMPAMKSSADKMTAEAKGLGADIDKLAKSLEGKKADAEKAADKAKEDLEKEAKDLEAEVTYMTAAKDAREAEAKRLTEKAEGYEKDGKGATTQVVTQTVAALGSAIYAFVVSLILGVLVQAMTLGNFSTSQAEETEGLDLTEHGEHGFDFGPPRVGYIPSAGTEPRAARMPPDGKRRFALTVEGGDPMMLARAWAECCQPGHSNSDPDFQAVYANLTTVQGGTFRFRAGDPQLLSRHLKSLFDRRLNTPVSVRLES